MNKLSPTARPVGEDNPRLAFCDICYNHFPSVNKTNCCGKQICTECIAATINPPSQKQSCPFCRKDKISFKPNITVNNGGTTGEDDDEKFIDFEARRQIGLEDVPIDAGVKYSPEVLRIAAQYNLQPRVVQDFLNQGITEEMIIESFEPLNV